MLTKCAGPDGLTALIVWADEHSIRDIQLNQMYQFGRDVCGALVVHVERVMCSGTRYWALIPFAFARATRPHVTILTVLGPNTERQSTSALIYVAKASDTKDT